MQRDDWEELSSQIQDHGPELVRFYLSGADENGHDMEIYPINIMFEDNEIKVVLE